MKTTHIPLPVQALQGFGSLPVRERRGGSESQVGVCFCTTLNSEGAVSAETHSERWHSLHFPFIPGIASTQRAALHFYLIRISLLTVSLVTLRYSL